MLATVCDLPKCYKVQQAASRRSCCGLFSAHGFAPLYFWTIFVDALDATKPCTMKVVSGQILATANNWVHVILFQKTNTISTYLPTTNTTTTATKGIGTKRASRKLELTWIIPLCLRQNPAIWKTTTHPRHPNRGYQSILARQLFGYALQACHRWWLLLLQFLRVC